MGTTIRYVCRVCAATWSRKVSQRGFQPLDRPFSAVCPGCQDDQKKDGSGAK